MGRRVARNVPQAPGRIQRSLVTERIREAFGIRGNEGPQQISPEVQAVVLVEDATRKEQHYTRERYTLFTNTVLTGGAGSQFFNIIWVNPPDSHRLWRPFDLILHHMASTAFDLALAVHNIGTTALAAERFGINVNYSGRSEAFTAKPSLIYGYDDVTGADHLPGGLGAGQILYEGEWVDHFSGHVPVPPDMALPPGTLLVLANKSICDGQVWTTLYFDQEETFE